MSTRKLVLIGALLACGAFGSGATIGLTAALAGAPDGAPVLPGLPGPRADAPPPKPVEAPAPAPVPAPVPLGGPAPKAGDPPAGLVLPPTLTVESTELFVTVTADTTADDVRWIVVASAPVKYEAIGKRLVLGTPPDTVIYVYAYGTVGGKATDAAKLVVTVKAPQPPPTPAPVPPKPQPPAPQPPPPEIGADAGKIYVTVIEDPAARIDNPWVAEILNDKPLRDGFERAGFVFRVLSVKDPEYARARLAPYVEAAGGVPALVVQNGKGKVFAPQKLPRTVAAVKEAVETAAAHAKE